MPTSLQRPSFNINAWSAKASGLSTTQNWIDWSQSLKWPHEKKIETHLIPAAMRRRMSSLSQLTVQTTIELLQSHEVDYLVFSSRHGELWRSAALIHDILNGEMASPFAFSQSVHNTAGSLVTIATQKNIPLTSISAAKNTFQSAAIEAWLYLEENPTDTVLLVNFDEPLPVPYQQYEEMNFNRYCIGFVLSKGNKHTFKLDDEYQDNGVLPQSLIFLRHYLTHYV